MTAPLKHLISPVRPITYGSVQAGPDQPGGIPYIRPTDMTPSEGVRDPSTLLRTSIDIAQSYARSTIHEGDIVLSIGPSFGKVMVVPPELSGANLTQGTARLAPSASTASRFLYWALQSKASADYWQMAVAGATFRALNLGPLGETPVPTHAMVEQRRIADFLDDQVARMDSAARLRESATELLLSVYQAQVDVAMETIQKRTPLRYLSALPITNGLGLGGTFDNPDWPRYIRTTDIGGPRSLRGDVFASQPPDVAKGAMLQQGDIVMTAAGATIGKNCLIVEEFPACFAGYLARFRPGKGVEPRFISHWMASNDYWSQIHRGVVRSTIDNFSAGKYRTLRVPLTSYAEQTRIADHLDGILEGTTRTAALHDRHRCLIRERKTALVTAAVTGQFDVTTARSVA